MAQPKKRATRARKCKCKCHISQSLEIRKKGQQIAKNDTLATQMPRDNAASIKVKIKRK